MWSSQYANKINLDRLEVDEKDTDGTVKELEAEARTSGFEDQNLVCQIEENSSEHLGKVVPHDYASGNQMLFIVPQTGEFSQQEKITPSPSQ